MTAPLGIVASAHVEAAGGPPTLVAVDVVVFNSAASPRDSALFTWQAGDVIVVMGAAAHSNSALTPTATGLTFTPIGTAASSGSWGWAHKFVATAAAPGSDNITLTPAAGGGYWGAVVYQFRGSAGIGNHNAAQIGTTPTLSLTTSVNSAVLFVASDPNTVSATQTLTPASPTPTERADGFVGGQYGYIAGDWLGVGAGTVAYGTTSGTGRDYFAGVVEVRGT